MKRGQKPSIPIPFIFQWEEQYSLYRWQQFLHCLPVDFAIAEHCPYLHSATSEPSPALAVGIWLHETVKPASAIIDANRIFFILDLVLAYEIQLVISDCCTVCVQDDS